MSLSLVNFLKFIFALKVNIYLQNMSIKRVFCCFICMRSLSPASLIMHVPIPELHVQWCWCLHFSMRLYSQRFIQFHPTVIMWHMLILVLL